MTTLTFFDETTSGDRTPGLTLDFPTNRVSVRELIRRRVYEEVREYNLREPDLFRGLVQPEGAERELNGYRLPRRRKIDWEVQYERAIQAFQRNGVLILVDDRQVEDLDTEIDLRVDTQVSFLRLVALVGG